MFAVEFEPIVCIYIIRCNFKRCDNGRKSIEREGEFGTHRSDDTEQQAESGNRRQEHFPAVGMAGGACSPGGAGRCVEDRKPGVELVVVSDTAGGMARAALADAKREQAGDYLYGQGTECGVAHGGHCGHVGHHLALPYCEQHVADVAGRHPGRGNRERPNGASDRRLLSGRRRILLFGAGGGGVGRLSVGGAELESVLLCVFGQFFHHAGDPGLGYEQEKEEKLICLEN